MTDIVPAPTDEHEPFRPFVGRFAAQVTLWMGPAQPEPMQMTGMMVNAWELGGSFISQHYTGDPINGMSFHGRGYWGFNTDLERYEGFWIDSASTQMQIEYGVIDPTGTRWTMTGDLCHPETKKMIQRRSEIHLEGPDRHLMTQFMVGEDGTDFKSMEIVYTRVAGV